MLSRTRSDSVFNLFIYLYQCSYDAEKVGSVQGAMSGYYG